MNKRSKLLVFSLAVMGGMLFTACGNNSSSSSEPWYKKSERAMKNFGEKLLMGNYTISIEDRVVVNVANENEITFKFSPEAQQTDFAVMGVNSEVFQATAVAGKELSNLLFLNKGTALHEAEVRLPNIWFDESAVKATISELWHNQDQSNPLHFNSKETLIKQSLTSIAWFGDFITPTFDNMNLTFDSENVNVATVTATIRPAATEVPFKMTITFGSAMRDERVKNWITDSHRTYPAPMSEQGAWPAAYDVVLTSATGFQGEIEELVPFIDFASYACWNNLETQNKGDHGVAIIRDYHATQENVDAYKQLLLRNEYQSVVEDGVTHYRRIMRSRNGKGAYADITVEYKSGFYMTVDTFYEGSDFANLAAINTQITSKGFPELSDNAALTGWVGEDVSFHAYEEKMGLFDFTIYVIGTATYTDKAAVKEYTDAYNALLAANGFTYNKADDAYEKDNVQGFWLFEFTQDDTAKTLSIRCYNEAYVDPEVAKADIEAKGFPELDIANVTSIRDIRAYNKYKAAMNLDLAYEAMFGFPSKEDSKSFTDAYASALIASGFVHQGSTGGFDFYSKVDAKLVVQIAQSTTAFAGITFTHSLD